MSKKILIVDDDKEIRTYLNDLFSDNGYETVTADDGKVAIEVAETEKPDLITLDLEMPGEWGPRFYRKLTQNEELKRTPVIVISGLNANKYAIPKAVAILTKPFDTDQLLSLVKETIGQRSEIYQIGRPVRGDWPADFNLKGRTARVYAFATEGDRLSVKFYPR
eukprot:TRINITY_DN136345_c0_g1_i1.p1 TRINITY_DN136345_c0_g1~~TRINITY_DN136345_c0_g1_i1.p1  ORF type:complete len:164 (+),score=31.10 TRINITY_DN136345_c0_g1_i1:151-642(+)